MSHDDLEPGIKPDERDALLELGDRLSRSRPVPSAGFRGDLRRLIVAHRPAPSWLRLRIAACAVSGATLLLVATLGVTGSGPLAPEPLSSSQQTASTLSR